MKCDNLYNLVVDILEYKYRCGKITPAYIQYIYNNIASPELKAIIKDVLVY
jgi:hypothetical protein